MANNRIIFSCKTCPNSGFTVAKYYPSTGWYLFALPAHMVDQSRTPQAMLEVIATTERLDPDNAGGYLRFCKRLDEWLETHSHGREHDNVGATITAGLEDDGERIEPEGK